MVEEKTLVKIDKIGNMRFGFTEPNSCFFTCPDDFSPAYMRRIIILFFALKPPLPTKFKCKTEIYKRNVIGRTIQKWEIFIF